MSLRFHRRKHSDELAILNVRAYQQFFHKRKEFALSKQGSKMPYNDGLATLHDLAKKGYFEENLLHKLFHKKKKGSKRWKLIG